MSKGLSGKVEVITGGSAGSLTIKLRLFFRPRLQVEDFEAAALRHLDNLYRSASLLLRNRAEAEDMVQEVYLHASKSFHRFEAGTDCRAWLFRILFRRLHHARHWLRESKMNGFASWADQDDIKEEPPVPQEIPNEGILLALRTIPVRFREVVLLADVEQFSYKDIAWVLEVPVGKVALRLSQGKELLRQELARICESCTESAQVAIESGKRSQCEKSDLRLQVL
jgi:RNA polymerase sigma-70 factor, ECF subfamily